MESPTPDYYSSVSIKANAIAATNITRGVAWITVALRFLARRKGRLPLLWDDWTILMVVAIQAAAEVVQSLEFAYGDGRHLGYLLDTDPSIKQRLGTIAILGYVDTQFYAPSVALVKISILLLYIRIFRVQQMFRRLCQAMIVLVIIWGLVTECFFLFLCSPVYLAWSVSKEGGMCLPENHILIGTNIPNIIMDFIILFMPMRLIWQLQLPIKKRILVLGILAIGGGTVIFSTLRLAMVANLTFVDTTWDLAVALIWSVVEVNMGIFLANIPTLAPLLPRSWAGRSASYKISGGDPKMYALGSNYKSNHKSNAVAKGRADNSQEDGIELISPPPERILVQSRTEVTYQ